ncbi:MAG: urease subunit alpha [Nitrososphaerota archaeon]|jgi:urease subunit alpha|nr:urease subunit alpha [Nitrososphaerota archaeon]MDG7041293.1 urease subunit alpha [Nitrososphaerota archaeon]MDG7046665.1 urease subunit alpha [Nitrososphaerota archaeon]
MKMSRKQYVDLYGPTKGDKVQLADTNLVIEVEKDYTAYGDELVFGGGKTIREGMGQSPGTTHAMGALDHVITNAIVFDPILGVVKADIGIRDGKIAGIGKAGNPGLMDGVDRDMVVSSSTEATAGEGMIATAGFFDTHVHMIAPQQAYETIANGITTYIGGGTGPADGTNAVTSTPGPWNIEKMIESTEGLPLNWLFLGKGNDSKPEPLAEMLEAGAGGFKMHEDWGATAASLDTALDVADKYDVQVSIHTDSLNEGSYVDDTIYVINGRTVHTYHTEGAGGGHAPDIMKIAGEPNVLPSSTNPTRPYTINTIDEHLDMLIVCHHLNPAVPEDVAFAESRIRAETIAAEDVFHDWGVLSMYSSDSQAMGRTGEVSTRAWQTAHKVKEQFGKLPEDSPNNDNFRALRYLAKLTINPAITNGVADYLGSLEKGKMADIVLWDPKFFGAKNKMVFKGGFIAYAMMGDPNASLPTVEPIYWRPMFGGFGTAQSKISAIFTSKVAYDLGIKEKYGLEHQVLPVSKTRNLGKDDMVRNSTRGDIEIDPETHKVKFNGKEVSSEPAKKLPLTQLYYLI